jgi:halogenation protein CepH
MCRSDMTADVVVIGGGPGGSTAATLIAMKGHRVVLLEKEQYPIYKIGESLLPSTVRGICGLLGVTEEIKAANFVVKRGGTFHWGKGLHPWTFSFSSSPRMEGENAPAYQVERMKFDLILLNNARRRGVDVRERHIVTSLSIEEGRVTGVFFTDPEGQSRFCSARFVVDASGWQTRVANYAGRRILSEFFQNVALFGYYHGGMRLDPPLDGNILCVAFEDGWFWYIPLSPSLTSVGVVVGKQHARIPQPGYSEAMEQFIYKCPPIRSLLANAERITEGPYGQIRMRTDYSYQNAKFWSPGLVLVGDSACFIDPVFSSGVHLATYAALLAARSINTCLDNSCPDQELREDACFGEFEARYRREYARFYEFLVAFYDTNNDLESYYWHAKRVTGSQEAPDRAFVEFLGGIGESKELVFDAALTGVIGTQGLSRALFPEMWGVPAAEGGDRRRLFFTELLREGSQMQLQAQERFVQESQQPLFRGGLVPSADGLLWSMPLGGLVL